MDYYPAHTPARHQKSVEASKGENEIADDHRPIFSAFKDRKYCLQIALLGQIERDSRRSAGCRTTLDLEKRYKLFKIILTIRAIEVIRKVMRIRNN